MADIFQGEPLPAITSTVETQAVAPEFYTNYLQDIANLGMAGITQGGVAGLSPLQQQALAMAPEAAFAGLGTMGTGAELAAKAGQTTAPQVVADYMNPYTRSVVDEMARLQEQNVQRSILPALQSVGVGSGGFGSQRQLQVGGQTLTDIQRNLLGQQAKALQEGYTQALGASQADLQRQMQAGTALGTLGTQQQTGATTGLGTLASLGAKEQELAQKMLDYPMTAAGQFSQLLRGLTIPTGEIKETTGSTAYSGSPLSQIAGLLSAIGAFANQYTQPTTPTTPGSNSVVSVTTSPPANVP
jgi:hypothetical protein